MIWFALSNNIFDGVAGSADGVSFVSRTIQSLLLLSFAPSSTTLPLYVTVTQCLRKCTPHQKRVKEREKLTKNFQEQLTEDK